MKHFTKIRDALPVLSALDSSVRIRMIELLLEKGPLYLDYFAKDLNISNAAVTKHIRILLDADIIQITTDSGISGSKKKCLYFSIFFHLFIKFIYLSVKDPSIDIPTIALVNLLLFIASPFC
jgi:predicted transcriptional regulator